MALLTSCSLSNEEQPGDVDSDVEAVLSVVLERMNAGGIPYACFSAYSVRGFRRGCDGASLR